MDELFAWIGNTDLKCFRAEDAKSPGPIGQAAAWRGFHVLHLLSNYPTGEAEAFCEWLRRRTKARIVLHERRLSSPTAHREIHEAAESVLREAAAASRRPPSRYFHLSPGTPSMHAVWLLLAKTAYPATLIESAADHGVNVVDFPIELSYELAPPGPRAADLDLIAANFGLSPTAPEFEDIVHGSEAMKRLILRARRVAPSSLPVLLLGESGTGKELFARAIHKASQARGGFIAVNCGAIPGELIDSELFGHERGAFTGANSPRIGHVESAEGGTLFLDEIGELPLHAQVRLLRVLQEREVVKVGGSRPRKVDFRLITATHRDLPLAVEQGRFREDLFHRIAVGVLQIPAVRERRGDLSLLIDHCWRNVARDLSPSSGGKDKKLSVGARNLLLQHRYPGNVRELKNILQRAFIWSTGPTISSQDIRDAIVTGPRSTEPEVLGRELGKDLKLKDLLDDVARHYLERAMKETGGNKSKAAELVGLPSYQTLTNWLKRYGVEE